MKINFLNEYWLYLIFVVSLVATLWSLYYGWYWDPVSNIMSWDLFNSENAYLPCELCWFARILMYPLVLISLIAIIKWDRKIVDYIIPISFIWTLLETYHYILQKFPILTSAVCTYNNPCSALEVNYFGFITIPLLCLIAFLIIFIVSMVIKKSL